MSNCTQTFGPWTATSRVGATLLAPVSVAVDATVVSAASVAADLALVGAGRFMEQASATSRTHKYINRPGSPPRGRLR